MAWTTPATFTTGNVLTAAQMNTNVRDNSNFLHSPPGCLAIRSTAQSISNNVLTAVSFTGTDVYDTDSMHDPVGAPTVLSLNTVGVYLVTASVQFAANATGARWMAVTNSAAGGTEIAGAKDSGPTSGINSILSASAVVLATPIGSQFGVSVQQTSGGSLSITNASTTTLTGNTPVIQLGAQWISDGT